MKEEILQRLERIEAKLDAVHASLAAVLDKRANAKKHTPAKDHDQAVAAMYATLNDPVKRAFQEYAAMRKDKRLYLTERSINAIMNKLDGFTPLEQVEALKAATEKEWRTVYPERFVAPGLFEDDFGA